MVMLQLCVTCALLLPLTVSAATDQSGTCETLDRNFARNIQKIVDNYHVEIPVMLLYSRTFMAIWFNAERFQKEAELFLQSGTATEDEQWVTVYAMRSLRLPQTLDFLQNMLALRKAGKITQKVFKRALFNDWDGPLVLRYRNPRVVALLREVQKSGLENNKYIDDILSGVERLRWKDRIFEGMHPDASIPMDLEEVRRYGKSKGLYIGLICGE
jgi:hypothetical protein